MKNEMTEKICGHCRQVIKEEWSSHGLVVRRSPENRGFLRFNLPRTPTAPYASLSPDRALDLAKWLEAFVQREGRWYGRQRAKDE